MCLRNNKEGFNISYAEKRIDSLLTAYANLYEKQFYDGDYDAVAELTDLVDAVQRADLTERQRECLWLVRLYGFREWEVGEMLGIDKSTVCHHIKVSIRKIANVYKEDYSDE